MPAMSSVRYEPGSGNSVTCAANIQLLRKRWFFSSYENASSVYRPNGRSGSLGKPWGGSVRPNSYFTWALMRSTKAWSTSRAYASRPSENDPNGCRGEAGDDRDAAVLPALTWPTGDVDADGRERGQGAAEPGTDDEERV